MSKPGSSKQKTLFQAWEGKVSIKQKKQLTKSHPVQRENKKLFTAQEAAKMCTVVDLTNDLDDEDLLEAVEVMESSMIEEQEQPSIKSEAIETIPGFDNDLGSMWIYPTNYPVRDYQYAIVKSALFKNTLVSLPTGLGKTFIAAVVMYNFYRWYPQGKVVFMAPTKPLVSQQIEACYKIMGIPYDDQAEITGITTAVHKREELWRTKRVFFLTPQVINNDLARGVCPANDIKCIVIDEAHKAQGKHAYCQVINQLSACSRMFRVLALSATPGTDVNSVQQVIHNLLISHIEIRSEESLDIRGYSHHRKIEKVVCKLDETMIAMRNNYLQVIELFTNSLVNKNALYQRDTANYSKYGILLSREQFRKNPPSGLSKYEMGTIEGDFATCISLFHGFELLQQHGMRSFYIFLKAMMEGEKGSLRAKTVLNANQTFREMFASLVQMFGHTPNPTVDFTQAGSTSNVPARSQVSREYVYSHPKIRKLEEVVQDHFANFVKNESSGETRVMVFCQYRDTVQEITELLQKHRPMVRPMQFVGHSNASGKMAKFTQKDQLKVVSKFRSGGYNTLISTCVGEEGLDIGDVDLIVCFDAHKSPIRLVQRMGRTGRKREGRIVMLVTEGKEERDYNSSVSNRKSIQKAITGNSSRSLHFYSNNPRMVPRGLKPQPLKMAMTVKARPNAVSAPKKKKTKSNNLDISLVIKKEEIKNPVYLTPDQVMEWDEKFKLSSNEKNQAKSFPAFGRMECLRDRSSVPQKGELSFSEWNLWQVRLQETNDIGHSSITKNFVEMMSLCDHMKQSESIEWDKNAQDKDSPAVMKQNSPPKKRKSPVVTKRLSLDNFITESPCNDDDTLDGIESIVDEDVHDHAKLEKKPVKMTPSSSHQKNQAKQTQKAESKNLPVHVPKKIPTQNTTKVDPLMDFINDLSDGSGDEPTPPKQSNSELSDQDTDEQDDDEEEEEDNDVNCEISDPSQAPQTKFDHPSPPLVDLLDDTFDDAQNFDSEDGQNFTQSFDFNFDDDEEDLFCNPQFDGTLKRKSVVETTEMSKNESKLKKDQTHVSRHDEVRSGFRKMTDNKKVANTKPTFQNEVVTKSRHSDNNCDPENSFPHTINKTGGDQSVDGCKKPAKTPLHPKGDFSHNFKVVDMEISTDAGEFKDSKKNCELPDAHIHHLSKDGEENVSGRCGFSETIPQANNFDENICDKDSEDIFSNSLNTGIPNFDLNASIDMFSPNFDFGFDIAPTNSAKSSKNMEASSPILTKSRKVKKEKQIEENSPGHITMTQKVENRALFADLGKSHDTSKTLIAQVKPQVKCKKSATISNSIPVPTLPIHEQDMDQESPFLIVRHKRSLDNSEHVNITKRKKDTPKTPTNSKGVLKIHEDSETVEDSPLFMLKKQKSQNKKLEFSPESDKSGYSPDKDKSIKKAASCQVVDETPACRKRLSGDKKRHRFSDNARKHSTPKALTAEYELSDEDFKGADNKRLKAKTCPPKRLLSKAVKDDFVDIEAEVSQDGVPISTDEEDDSEADPAVLEEMKNFVNDASILTQHVGNGPAVDEHAMYLRGNADFFDEGGQFGNSKAKFKLAFNIRSDIDVFSQESAGHESDYEQDSFVCDDEVQHDSSDFGEITLLDRIDSPILAGKLTRRQVELNRLKKFNKDSSVVTEKKNQDSKKTAPRKRIICFDDSTESTSTESAKSSDDFHKKISEKETGWTCPACTLVNKPSCMICELCDCERPSSDVTRQPAWTCKSCTYINGGQNDVCNMCGKLRMHQKSKQKTHKSDEQQQPCTSRDKCSTNTKLTDTDWHKFLAEKADGSANTQDASSSTSCIVRTPTGNLEIEERLKRVMKKRLDFKAKRASLGTQHQVPMKSAGKDEASSMSDVRPQAQDVINTSVVSPSKKSDTESGPIVVLVDSKELSSSQPIITMLRSKFQANVTVASLPHCDYIIGIGTAVTRLMVSDVSQVSTKQKLSTKFQQLNVHYDRVYAIIEQDSVKKGDVSKRIVRSTHFMSMMCCLAQCNIRVLYSDNQDETAGILKMLAARERDLKRAIGIDAAAKANDSNSRLLLKLFLNMPKVSFVSALYMCLHFKTFKEAASSSVEKLIQKAHLSTYAAAEVYTFCRRKFDIQMTPTR